MPLQKEIIDNSEENKLINFLNNTLRENPKTKFDIATAFFNIEAFTMIKDNLNGIERFRLLLGKTPEIQNENILLVLLSIYYQILSVIIDSNLL